MSWYRERVTFLSSSRIGPEGARRRARALALVALGCGAAVGCAPPTKLADISYDDRFGDATTLDLFLPATPGPHPAVVLIHGGLFTRGDKEEYGAAAARLAGSGYVAATINHRLAPGARFPAAVQDAGCALSFLRNGAADYGIDPGRVAVVGYSSGGYLASMLGVASEVAALEPDCDAGASGPPEAVATGAGLFDLVEAAGEAEVQAFLGGDLGEAPERHELASPVSHVGAGEPPHLLVHGEIDWVVPSGQSKRMRDVLAAEGNDVRLLSLADPGHFLAAGADNGGLYGGGAKDRPESWIALADFLEETLGAP